ncbi:MAG: exodeoxyribonuclease III [Burkholderiaceae bacterium]
MDVVSLNLNGIRSAHRKGVFNWLAQAAPDLLCVQELKAQADDLSPELLSFAVAEKSFESAISCADKKGYSGVGLFSHWQPSDIRAGFGVKEFDSEGRLIAGYFETQQTGLDKPLWAMSLYAPSGSASEDRQASKFRFMQAFYPRLKQWIEEAQTQDHHVLICGDWNIARSEKDLKNWRGNQKNSGFLPEERAWMNTLVEDLGWVDVYRLLYPEAEGEGYTWWSNRGNARANNVGWRIDYQLASPGLAAKAQKAWVVREPQFSDHAPLVVRYASC